jgi:hypothetical protein
MRKALFWGAQQNFGGADLFDKISVVSVKKAIGGQDELDKLGKQECQFLFPPIDVVLSVEIACLHYHILTAFILCLENGLADHIWVCTSSSHIWFPSC